MKKPLLLLVLLLTYALLLGHDLLPHHHHGEHDGAVAHRHSTGHDHHHHHDDAPAGDESQSDEWFAHQHAPGVCLYSSVDTNPPRASAVADAKAHDPLTFRVQWRGLTVGWPPVQAKAPPGPYRFRPLRAPPFSFSLVG